ncbi:hypothetical protein KDA_00200 [Dictyobacter alpinus]|uniref:DeoR-like transcriptional repressor C-terminal sensor domain-containing protein n=1 Tax=Dictyobacter alpinus TaxID=2014873 RepID=A0A402AZK0_9CHLR|nr:hypothetical protein KDA_00200 [Dictyobacter alpinus]
MEMGFNTREQFQHDKKEHIGTIATSYVLDGETIALDARTTALAMSQFLKARKELTVVTNGLRIGMELINTSGISVLIPGIVLRYESFSLIST